MFSDFVNFFIDMNTQYPKLEQEKIRNQNSAISKGQNLRNMCIYYHFTHPQLKQIDLDVAMVLFTLEFITSLHNPLRVNIIHEMTQ